VSIFGRILLYKHPLLGNDNCVGDSTTAVRGQQGTITAMEERLKVSSGDPRREVINGKDLFGQQFS
jgi:hypothetical protein